MKQALVIMPNFFEYDKYIVYALKKLGYDSCVVYENLEEKSLFYRLFIRLKIANKETLLFRYYQKKIKAKNYSVVLIIRGSTVNHKVMQYIKTIAPNAKYFMYQWDSVKNNENAIEIARYFDRISSFDYFDCQKYQWVYRPLFYIESSMRDDKRKFDIAYICTLHSERMEILRSLSMNHPRLKKIIYIYTPFPHFINQKYLKKDEIFLNTKVIELHFKPLSLNEINGYLRDSNIVIDYTHPNQTGLTMRTIESIGHKCKLVTNNQYVKDCDFYNKNNVYVYENKQCKIPDSFLNSTFEELDKDIYEKYTIDSWIKEVLDE